MFAQDYQDHSLIVYINTWMNESGILFDFNSSEYEESFSFKPLEFKLQMPPINKEAYYFFHQPLDKDFRNRIHLEYRTKMVSECSGYSRQGKNFKLMGGIKLKVKFTQSKRIKVYMNLLPACIIDKENSQEFERSYPYVIVRSLPKGYFLKSGQHLKLGKMQFLITQISTQVQNNRQQFQQNQILDLDGLIEESQLQVKENSQNERQCKICMIGQDTEDPLISPCKCKGSTKHIHISCLKKWIEMKMQKMRNDGSGHMYHTNQLFCEICKQPLPKAIRRNGQLEHMLTFLDDADPYMAISPIINSLENAEIENSMYVTVGETNTARVGRLFDNGVILEDPSVSRQHAEIQLTNNKTFLIRDQKSKYGTLVYDPKAEIRLGYNIRAFQICSTVFALRLEKRRATRRY